MSIYTLEVPSQSIKKSCNVGAANAPPLPFAAAEHMLVFLEANAVRVEDGCAAGGTGERMQEIPAEHAMNALQSQPAMPVPAWWQQ
jgi:hypothetical protein